MARESMSQIKQKEDKMAENASNKRKWKGSHSGSSSQQQNKEPKVIRAHTVGPSDKKGNAGNLPLCNKCKFHHTGPCAAKVAKQKAEVTCHECGMLGHSKSDCPIWRCQNRVNKYLKEKTHGDSNVIANNVDV
ncbi:reverse transcriptase domain-containing protein [Tanacetum coccineum]